MDETEEIEPVLYVVCENRRSDVLEFLCQVMPRLVCGYVLKQVIVYGVPGVIHLFQDVTDWDHLYDPVALAARVQNKELYREVLCSRLFS
jgi:hypothetical protein